MIFTSLIALSSIAMGVTAAAVVAPAPSSLAVPEHAVEGVQLGTTVQLSKRTTEAIHLVNCVGGGFAYSIEIVSMLSSKAEFGRIKG